MTRAQSAAIMVREVRQADIAGLIERLRPHNTLNPPQGYWIETPAGDMQFDPDGNPGGSEWCQEHAEDLIMRLNLYTPGDGEYLLSALDTGGIYDTIPHCAACGMTLAGWPNHYCRDEELWFFEENPDWLPTPENIHVVGMMLSNMAWGGGPYSNSWIAIGEAVLVKLEATHV